MASHIQGTEVTVRIALEQKDRDLLKLINKKLNTLLRMERADEKRDIEMSKELDDAIAELGAAANETKDATQSVMRTFETLAAKIEEADDADEAGLVRELAGRIRTEAKALAEAAVQNKPFEPSGA